jgi:hypothetical protein
MVSYLLLQMAQACPRILIFKMPSFPKLPVLILLILFLSPVPVSAAPEDLYTGEAPVASQQASERKRALPQALLQVLQKLSGLRDFADYPMLSESLRSAESYVVSFYYRNQPQLLADGGTQTELKLVAKFSEPAVNELVQSLALPLWQTERGFTEIWVVVDDGLDRYIFPVEFQYVWDAMGRAAEDRGLPVSWPVADEDGQYLVDEQLLWGGYTEDLLGMGRGGVLVAAARREGPEWSVRINLAYRQQSWTWRNRDVDLQFLLTESVEQAADLVAAANTIAAADRGSRLYELTVNGVNGSEAYSRCLAYLQGLSVVDAVSVRSARAGQVRYRLQLNALPQYLEDTLNSGRVLDREGPDGDYVLRP